VGKSIMLLGSIVAAGVACSGGAPKPAFEAAPGSPVTVAAKPGNVIAGDLNGDKMPDLVVGCAKELVVLLGDGKGGFKPAPGSPLQSISGEMGLGDINGDGKPDLALTNHDTYEVTVLLGDGKGGFAPAPGSPIVMKKGKHPHNHGLALVDLDGDGRLDLLTLNSDDNDMTVQLGDGKGGFKPAPGSPFPAGPSPYPPAVGDVNGDGRPDVVIPNTKSGSSSVTVLLDDGRGGFTPAPGSPVATIERPYFLALGDLDGDAKPDMVVAHDDTDEVTILLGDGKGRFKPAKSSPIRLGGRSAAVVVTDVTGDGKADIVAAAGESVRVFAGDGRGGFQLAPGSPFAAGKGTWRLAVADFNGDGQPDIAATGFENDRVTVLLGR